MRIGDSNLRWLSVLIPLSACGFEVGVSLDAGHPDTPPDQPPPMVTAASCKALHTSAPTMPSAKYTIDPDGSGPDSSLMADCDMTTAGGGWTIVFTAADPNLTSTSLDYTTATPRLLADASEVLVVYRDGASAISGAYATFAIPAPWRTTAPFGATAADFQQPVSINGRAPVSATIRVGTESFYASCTDPWDSISGPFGRFCITNTNAPFYSGFASTWADACSDSLSVWDARACMFNLRFSLAVR